MAEKLWDALGVAFVVLATWGCLWLLSFAEWRDRYGQVHLSSRAVVPWWRADRRPWWDEVSEGMLPGRRD